jgi:hypothetical protein
MRAWRVQSFRGARVVESHAVTPPGPQVTTVRPSGLGAKSISAPAANVDWGCLVARS